MTARTRLGLLLILVAGFAFIVSFPRSANPEEVTYGVSRVDGEPGIAIHWVLCGGVAPRSVDLEGYWGGSSLPTDVAVFWQVRSDAPGDEGPRVATYVVGQTPSGFYQTVPFRAQLPADLIVISAPPGDETSLNGMSFHASQLARDAIYRGDYIFVSPQQFAADGRDYCESAGDRSPLSGLPLAALGLGGILVAGTRRPLGSLLAGIVATGGILTTLSLTVNATLPVAARQEPSAFQPGETPLGDGRGVLARLSPTSGTRPGGTAAARFGADRDYAFLVSCDGISLQIGEASDTHDGSTGGRKIIGCNTGQPVRGTIADRSDRDVLVTVVVNPNGVTDWSVLVVSGGGEVGPFGEP